MYRTRNAHFKLAVVIAAMVSATACDSTTEITPAEQSLDVFVGSGIQALAVDRGATAQLNAATRDASGKVIQPRQTVSFVSRNTQVVSVNGGGVVTAVGGGQTYVLAILPREAATPLIDSIGITVVAR